MKNEQSSRFETCQELTPLPLVICERQQCCTCNTLSTLVREVKRVKEHKHWREEVEGMAVGRTCARPASHWLVTLSLRCNAGQRLLLQGWTVNTTFLGISLPRESNSAMCVVQLQAVIISDQIACTQFLAAKLVEQSRGSAA